MKLTFFSSCQTLDQAKQLYKTLAKLHHPDKGGDVEVMKIINTEYELVCSRLIHKMDCSDEEKDKEVELSELYREKISHIIHLDGIFIELVGSWLWITGDTYKLKTKLKNLQFFWANNKKAWFWRPEDQKSLNRKPMSLEAIRSKYGSKLFFGDKLTQIKN